MLEDSPVEFVFEDIIVKYHSILKGDISRGFMPAYHYRIFDKDDNDVGDINFRIGDSDHIRYVTGHIGYEIWEEYQGHHYARKACFAISTWVSEKSGKVIITTDLGNIASIKTIEAIGAKFKDEVDIPINNPHYQTGRYTKLRYIWEPLAL